MKLEKEIGGYFGLVLGEKKNNLIDSSDNIYLNSARNCLRYVIKAFDIKEIYLPFYTCPVVWQSVQKEKCKINFYHIDNNFMPVIDFPDDAFILYTNYFGICAKNVKKLASKYKNLIIDNAQAFYMPKYGIASFNSVRKFFGVSDGAILSSDKKYNDDLPLDTSYQRFSHLLKRLDVSASFGYNDFCQNDDSLMDTDLTIMSNLTKKIVETIDIEAAKIKRLKNFNVLKSKLTNNEMEIVLDKDDVPMVYPFLLKNEDLKLKLIKNKIYVATYWSPMPQDYREGYFQRYLIPLPIDQRYDEEDMEYIAEVINE